MFQLLLTRKVVAKVNCIDTQALVMWPAEFDPFHCCLADSWARTKNDTLEEWGI